MIKLENREGMASEAEVPSQGAAATGWRAKHMILGYEVGTPREDLERRSGAFVKRLGCGLADGCLGPFGPRKFGLIAKIRVRDGGVTKVVFAAKRLLEKRGGQDWPKWAAEGSSPEQGRRKTATVDAVKAAASEYDKLDIDATSTIWWRASESARFDVATARWNARRRWQGMGDEMNISLDDINATVMAAGGAPP